MSDITQSETNGDIQFSANTAKADTWMQQNYGNPTITIPKTAINDLLSFKRAAEAAGFSVTSF